MASMLLFSLFKLIWFWTNFIVFQEEDYDVPEELEDIIGWSTISFSQQKLILKTFYWIQQRWKTFASCESVKIVIDMFNRILLQ